MWKTRHTPDRKIILRDLRACVTLGSMDDHMRDAAEEALRRLKARYKTYSAAADELGLTRQAIRDWAIKGRVSHKYCMRVSDLTGIPVEELRPDIFGTSTSSNAA